MPASYEFYSSILWRRLYRISIASSLKCSVKLTSEATWIQSFLVGKFITMTSISLIARGMLRLPISSWVSFGRLYVFQVICLFYLHYQIYWHRVLTVFPYYLCNVCRICFISFLTVVICVFSFSFLISLASVSEF